MSETLQNEEIRGYVALGEGGDSEEIWSGGKYKESKFPGTLGLGQAGSYKKTNLLKINYFASTLHSVCQLRSVLPVIV